MTEYGRGPGSEPWHPEDPLYGDNGWGGQAEDGQSPYGGQPQQYPQQPHQQQYGEWANGQQGGYGQEQQYHGQGQQQYTGQEQQQYVDPAQQQYGGQGQQQYADPGQQQYQGQQQYGGQGQQQYAEPGQQQYQGQQYTGQGQQQYDNSGWGSGAHQQVPYAADPADPYGGQPVAYGGQQPDQYGTPDAYPPPEPPARRRAEPEPEPDWDPGPDQGEHAFFAGGGDDDLDDDDPRARGGRGDRKGRDGKGKKRRSGCACLVVVLVFGGGLGGVGYFGYQFYQNRFGSAPDFAGEGTGESVNVTIPKGSGGYAIGQALKEAGVVKSVDAFVAAQSQNSKGNSIQAGVYTLKKEMSAESAVALMLNAESRNNLIIAEGKRNAEIYAMVDDRLEVKSGTTEGVADKEWKSFGLPDWANTEDDIKDPLEGFLYPSSYPVSKGMKPADVLKQMVDLAKEKYAEFGLESKAESLNLKDPLQLLTVASLVQKEGKYKHDFEKVATVVYNRLKPDNTETYGLLDFDSTVNYLKGESKLATGSVDDLRKIDDPYNTYKIKGLPPGPISNPGDEAIEAALKPAKGNWYYFVSVSADKTLFAETNEEQNANREKYLEELKEQ
ncbi:endolytic transglycosylase MltG [Streptomyces sp. NPDC127072]|uniref:endolytic transglycosylase MltG n=1 Tax=Streptomyces sp. NPDC127072 TaxID=3347129 RepID=UPI003667F333